MNYPGADPVHEIEWIAGMGLEFIDLTLEPPGAASWSVDTRRIRNAIEAKKLGVVGHTAFYLPLASALKELRRAAVNELCRCLEKFSEIGAKWMNVHPDRFTPMHERAFYIKHDIESLHELIESGKRLGVGVMIENLPGDFNNAAQLGELLDPLPDLGLHLDIGHANLMVPFNTTEEIMNAYGSRLRHVHLHDNKGGHADLHLPLGTGTVPLETSVKALKKAGYDGTVTLEVFTPDRHYLSYSRDVLRRTWDAAVVNCAPSGNGATSTVRR